MTIAQALREATNRLDWSPAKIAGEVGVAEQSVRGWLKGAKVPTGDNLMAMRRVIPGFADLLDAVEVA